MQHFRSIHYLRGIAAAIIVIFHICTTFTSIDPGLKHSLWLQSGVNIFFVISGFVMMKSTHNTSKTTKQFLIDRFIRIVPIYWAITLYIFACNPYTNSKMFLPSLLFVPIYSEDGSLISALIPPAWTLYLELVFYLIFAFMIGFSERNRILYTGVIFAFAVALGHFLTSKTLLFYANPVILEFWLGMLLAAHHRRSRWWMFPIGVGLLYFAMSIPVPIISPFTIGAFLVVAGLVSLESRMKEIALLRALGDCSYVLYLTHMITIMTGLSLFGGALKTSPAPFVLGVLFASIAIAFMIHTVVEKPLVKWFKNLGRHSDGLAIGEALKN